MSKLNNGLKAIILSLLSVFILTACEDSSDEAKDIETAAVSSIAPCTVTIEAEDSIALGYINDLLANNESFNNALNKACSQNIPFFDSYDSGDFYKTDIKLGNDDETTSVQATDVGTFYVPLSTVYYQPVLALTSYDEETGYVRASRFIGTIDGREVEMRFSMKSGWTYSGFFFKKQEVGTFARSNFTSPSGGFVEFFYTDFLNNGRSSDYYKLLNSYCADTFGGKSSPFVYNGADADNYVVSTGSIIGTLEMTNIDNINYTMQDNETLSLQNIRIQASGSNVNLAVKVLVDIHRINSEVYNDVTFDCSI
jgi:hypothetical protein